MVKSRAWALGVVACLVFRAVPATGDLVWPDTDLSKRVQAWFAQIAGSEDDAQAFFKEHLSPEALTDVPVTERLARRRTMLQRLQSFTAVEVVEATPTHMRVRMKTGAGNEASLVVDADDAAPHLIKAISMMVNAGGPPP